MWPTYTGADLLRPHDWRCTKMGFYGEDYVCEVCGETVSLKAGQGRDKLPKMGCCATEEELEPNE